jgi:hypothetical protein
MRGVNKKELHIWKAGTISAHNRRKLMHPDFKLFNERIVDRRLDPIKQVSERVEDRLSKALAERTHNSRKRFEDKIPIVSIQIKDDAEEIVLADYGQAFEHDP